MIDFYNDGMAEIDGVLICTVSPEEDEERYNIIQDSGGIAIGSPVDKNNERLPKMNIFLTDILMAIYSPEQILALVYQHIGQIKSAMIPEPEEAVNIAPYISLLKGDEYAVANGHGNYLISALKKMKEIVESTPANLEIGSVYFEHYKKLVQRIDRLNSIMLATNSIQQHSIN